MPRSTIAEILARHGIEPAPERVRKTTWKEFLTRHWELIAAADFFTVEVWTRRGLQRFVVLFFIDLSTRRVEIAGIATGANRLWMSQIVRNLTDAVDGILKGKRYLIHDRDPLFTTEFLGMLETSGVKSVKLPQRSPNLNAHAERFARTIKESCLERLILFGETSLRTTIHNFVVHYHTERNHQGLANQIINPEPGLLGNAGGVQRRQRLGGMLNYLLPRRLIWVVFRAGPRHAHFARRYGYGQENLPPIASFGMRSKTDFHGSGACVRSLASGLPRTTRLAESDDQSIFRTIRGPVIELAEVGGLHHRYERRSA